MRPRPNRPTARSTRGRQAAGSARTRQMPTAMMAAVDSGSRKNQNTTWWVVAGAGSDHPGTRSTATFCRAPSR